MLRRMAQESGIETPTAEDLARFDRKRKGKTLSNADWKSATDPDAKIAKMKDGTTHLAYKPEHAVDLDTGVVVAALLAPRWSRTQSLFELGSRPRSTQRGPKVFVRVQPRVRAGAAGARDRGRDRRERQPASEQSLEAGEVLSNDPIERDTRIV
jgi:hypothetical protein